ncbi:MAG: hypothetical protein BGO67_12950 [Alphaproteobacteria bacterium 41-28]|nr:MAG: hypothetical protein BGO67_12950 [Alphaproteobacteria bacterium 41-28]
MINSRNAIRAANSQVWKNISEFPSKGDRGYQPPSKGREVKQTGLLRSKAPRKDELMAHTFLIPIRLCERSEAIQEI